MELLQHGARFKPAYLLYAVSTNEELLQIEKRVEVFHHFDLVVLQVKVCKVLGEINILNDSDPIVREIQALQIDASIEPFNRIDLFVAQIDVRQAL